MELPAFFLRACFVSLLAMLFLSLQQLKAQLTYNELSVQYDSAWIYKKLQLIPVRFKGSGTGASHAGNKIFGDGKVISFSDALRSHKVVIKETSSGGGPDVTTL